MSLLQNEKEMNKSLNFENILKKSTTITTTGTTGGTSALAMNRKYTN